MTDWTPETRARLEEASRWTDRQGELLENVFVIQADLAAALSEIDRMRTLETGWRPIESAPKRQWLITAREGERGANLSMTPDGDEWCFQDGSTTVTHHTRLAPTHWMPLPDAPQP